MFFINEIWYMLRNRYYAAIKWLINPRFWFTLDSVATTIMVVTVISLTIYNWRIGLISMVMSLTMDQMRYWSGRPFWARRQLLYWLIVSILTLGPIIGLLTWRAR